MKVITIDTNAYKALSCPSSGVAISFYEPIDTKEVLERTLVNGFLSPEMPDEIETNDQELRNSWSNLWEAQDHENDFPIVEEVLEQLSWPDTMALQITAPAGASLAGTIFLLVK